MTLLVGVRLLRHQVCGTWRARLLQFTVPVTHGYYSSHSIRLPGHDSLDYYSSQCRLPLTTVGWITVGSHGYGYYKLAAPAGCSRLG